MMVLSSILLSAVVTQVAVTEPAGNETWGGRKAHPAVVHSVMAIPNDPNVVSLRGIWDLAATPADNRRNTAWADVFLGKHEIWKGVPQRGVPTKVRKAEVPACWESQFMGDEITMGRVWSCNWDCSPVAIRGYHCGEGWYRREVVLPAAWKGKRVWLKTGWVNSVGHFYVNGEQVAMDRNYCATYKYDVTDLVRLGETNLVVVQVNNEMPSHKGCINSNNHWGGILREPEFEATPSAVWIDDAWVRGDFDTMSAEVHVELGGDAKLAKVVTKVPDNLKPWSPEHPNLYTARVDLVALDGSILQTRYERFGIRKLEVRGTDVFLNGQPFFLRGAGWHQIDPINGFDKPDRATYLAHARQIRAAGFNIVRNHTHCKPPEYYEACDEAGLMIEAELPYYGDVPSDSQRFDPLADVEMLYRHFRRHPSFAIYSFGNEGSFGKYLDERLYREVKARDPDRLVISQDGSFSSIHATCLPGTSDFAGAPVRVRPRNYYSPGRPFFYHEYINSSVKLDSRIAEHFTGVWAPPVTRDGRLKFLQRFGLDHTWGDLLQDGQNCMQKIYLKYGLEAARLDQRANGYSFWSLQDACSPQGEAVIGQGLWDPFWQEKRKGVKTCEVAQFNSPSCVLMTDGDDVQDYADRPIPPHFGSFLDSTVTNLVRAAGETIKARFHFAHYEGAALENARLDWSLIANNETLLSGSDSIGNQPLGKVRKIGEADIVVPSITKAVKARLVATVTANHGFSQSNEWTYWLFPKRQLPDASRVGCAAEFYATFKDRYPGLLKIADSSQFDYSLVDTVIAPKDSALENAALKAGKSVVALANQHTDHNVKLGWWYMSEQMGAALKSASPFLSLLPHEGIFNQLLFRVGRCGLKLPVNGFKSQDFLMVGEGGKGCYLYLASKPLANGQRHSLIAGIDVLSNTPEGNAILDGLIFGKDNASTLARQELSLNGAWQFRHEGDAEWTQVTVPHDWAIKGPFNPNEPGNSAKLPWKGKGEYVREFELSASMSAQLERGGRCYLLFDGVMSRPEVFVNDVNVGGWDYGYMSFKVDATAVVQKGVNVLRVTADTTRQVSRWYCGGGIYRDVCLVVVAPDGAIPGTAVVKVDLPSTNLARISVKCDTVSGKSLEKNFEIPNPRRWDVDDPYLYEVEIGGERVRYGIREAKFTADDGFHLNGHRVQLKGVNLHADFGPLGAAFNWDAAKRQLLIMKDMGVNAIRTSHNPRSPKFLDLCDELGFVVWDECFDKWNATAGVTSGEDVDEYLLKNLRAFIHRDQNHPSVVVWSIGNEMRMPKAAPDGNVTPERVGRLADAVRAIDSSRPVAAGCDLTDMIDAGCWDSLDLTGWNYGRRYAFMRAHNSKMPLVYSESASTYSDFGFYAQPPAAFRNDYSIPERKTDSYDHTSATWSDIPDIEFYRIETDRYVAGEFVWTGIDYLGEPCPYQDMKGIPLCEQARSSYFGVCDLAGFPKDRFYLYRSHWNPKIETCHLVPGHWNFSVTNLPVYVYTSGDEAELFLNGRSLGRRSKHAPPADYQLDFEGMKVKKYPDFRENPYYRVCDKYRLRWLDVHYEPGELKAVCYRQGHRIGETKVCTASKPAGLRLRQDSHSCGALAYVEVELVDAAGNRMPFATDNVTFSVEGAGELVATANADPRDYEIFASPTRKLYFGKAFAIIRRTGEGNLSLKASTIDFNNTIRLD